MSKLQEIAIRLVEERAKRGLTQQYVAEKTGKSRKQYINYETGKSEMTVEFLAMISQLGLDIQYIITGVRSINTEILPKVTDAPPSLNMQGNISHTIIAGSGSKVSQVNTQQHITRTKAEVKPGIEHITDEQKATLQRLVNEIVELEARYRTEKSAKKHQAVWRSLNSKLKVTSYHLIPLNQYETARKHLQSWIGRLNSTKTAINKDTQNMRNRLYAYIHVNVQKLSLEEWYRNFLSERYSVLSAKDLDDKQLRQLYQAVAYRVKKAQNSS